MIDYILNIAYYMCIQQNFNKNYIFLITPSQLKTYLTENSKQTAFKIQPTKTPQIPRTTLIIIEYCRVVLITYYLAIP